MARQLEGLYDPKTGAVGMAQFSVMMMRQLNGHITSRQEILDGRTRWAANGRKRR